MNKVMISGTLAKPPELRQGGEKPVTNLWVKFQHSFRNSEGEEKTKDHFITVVAWGRLAENICEYLEEGSGLVVEGHLEYSRWKDKKSGEMNAKHSLVAETVQFA